MGPEGVKNVFRSLYSAYYLKQQTVVWKGFDFVLFLQDPPPNVLNHKDKISKQDK